MGKSEYALSDNDRELYRPFSVVRQLSPASATALEFFSPLGFPLIAYLRLPFECFDRVWACLSRVGGCENQNAKMLNFDL